MKERITGAIILVALLVLLVPELLTGPSSSVRVAQPATSADGAQMRSYTIDLADDAGRSSAATPVAETPTANAADGSPGDVGGQPGSSVDDDAKGADGGDASATAYGDAEQTKRSALTSAEPESPPKVASESAQPPAAGRADAPGPTPDPRTESPKPAAPRGESPKPAMVAGAETSKPAQREPATTTRAEAPPTAHPSESPARAGNADSKPTSGWAVQVGSFASRDNAERLAQKLKGKGFAATISQTPKGRRLWRVRVGPEPDRAAATALGAKLRSAGQPGAVVPYP